MRFAGGGTQTLRARREVLLAAGAIGSPQLLQLSGIGPAELLREHGVAVVADLPGVGANLHDHLQIRSIYKVRNTRHAEPARAHPGSAKPRWRSSTRCCARGR